MQSVGRKAQKHDAKFEKKIWAQSANLQLRALIALQNPPLIWAVIKTMFKQVSWK
jgi:hypothetical protein